MRHRPCFFRIFKSVADKLIILLLSYCITSEISVPSVLLSIHKVENFYNKLVQCLMPPNTSILLYLESCKNPVDKIRFELREKYCRWCSVMQNEGRFQLVVSHPNVKFFIVEHTEGHARPSHFKHFEPPKKMFWIIVRHGSAAALPTQLLGVLSTLPP